MQKTLVVHTGGIGDLILTFPALALLRNSGSVTLAGAWERVSMAKHLGAVDDAESLDRIHFDTLFSEPSSVLREFVSGFDRVVVWMKDDGVIRSRLHHCGVDRVDVFPGIPPETWTRHASDYFVECLGWTDLPERTIDFHRGQITHDILIHPGSGGQKKNWPIDRFHHLADALRAIGRDTVWIRGPAEETVSTPPNATHLPNIELTSLADELSRSRLYIGNDSGITHLAAVVGCDVVAIFGPTNPRVWAPRGAHVRVVQRRPWPSVVDVLEAIADLQR